MKMIIIQVKMKKKTMKMIIIQIKMKKKITMKMIINLIQLNNNNK